MSRSFTGDSLSTWPNIEIEGPIDIHHFLVIPLKGAKSELEGVHSTDSVFYFLISALQGLVIMGSILIADEES